MIREKSSGRLRIAADYSKKEEKYWLDKFSGEITGSNFPYDYGRNGKKRVIDSLSFTFPGDLCEKVQDLSNDFDQVLHMILTAGVLLLLHKYTFGSTGDITIGAPIYRQDSEGEFINTVLPLRCALKGERSFKELLLQIREMITEAVENQNYPMETLLYKLDLSAVDSHFPLFDVVVLLKNIHDKGYISHTNPNVLFSFFKADRDMECSVEYNSSLYRKSTIQRIAGNFVTLMGKAVSDVNERVESIAILTEEEKIQLLIDFNDTGAGSFYSIDTTIQRLFEVQAEKTPHRIASVCRERQVTYGQLDNKAAALSAALRRKAVGSGSIVAVMTYSSIEMAVGIMGILKSGGAYFPIDLEIPVQRMALMFKDSNTKMLLTTRTIARQYNPSGLLQGIDILGIDDSHLPAEPLQDRNHPGSPTSPAYVIFTSGSTGLPKGVLVEHRSAVNTLLYRKREYRMNSQTTALQLFSYAFDGFVTGFFTPLISGARVILLHHAEASDIDRIKGVIFRNLVTHFICVPALYKIIIESMTPQEAKTIETVTLAGDRVPIELVKATVEKNPGTEVAIEYGVTEAAVMSTLYRHQEKAKDNIVKIGKPVSNTKLYILDCSEMPLPVGTPGELCIGGIGPARGYLNNPELTEKKYRTVICLPGKRTGTPGNRYPMDGDRLYKSGDLAKWHSDGNIEFVGRIDEQVKIRGFRVETGEVEFALLSHGGVREAAVIVGEAQGNHLYAYVAADQDLSPADLREYLSGKLPDYMIPTYIIPVENIPLSPNGKVDKKALASLAIEVGGSYTAPRDELEEKLVAIWQEVLGKDKIGIHDNFFELGGNSLKGMIIVNHYKKFLKENVYITVVFEAQTIAELAAYFREYYPAAVSGITGTETTGRTSIWEGKINDEKIEKAYQVLSGLQLRDRGDSPKNKPAIFILSPQRSGSTLLRVMLGGNPKLFAPQELGLLMFDTLAQAGGYRHSSIRALMEIKQCTAEHAEHIIKEFEDNNMDTKQFYHLLQEWLGDRLLVDKTPNYSWYMNVLKRVEAEFENPLYIHLVRHPYGMIHSKAEAKLDIMKGVSLSGREISELEWVISNRNILDFLKNIPAARQIRITFENLLEDPRATMEKVCDFANVKFHADMLDPYKDTAQRMTDSVYKEGIMIGDPKFHTHKSINSGVANRWKRHITEDFLGDAAWELAEGFGYSRLEEAGYSSIKAVEKKEYYPLSSSQKRQFILDRMDVDNTNYIISNAFPLQRDRGPDGVRETFSKLISRHESLRTSFTMVNDKPVQRVHDEVEFSLEYYEGGNELWGNKQTGAPVNPKEIMGEFKRPFDLAKAPLLRAGLLEATNDKYIILFGIHHIITDKTSNNLLRKEFMELYSGKGLVPIGIQYKDYSVWHNRRKEQESIKRQEEYWIELFSDELPVLNLPTDYPRPAMQSFAGASVSFVLDQAENGILRDIVKKNDVTLYMAILAIFNMVLARFSGQEDIIVGTPIDSRRHIDTEKIMGMFLNTLPMRNKPVGEKIFKEFLKEIKERTLEVFANQEYQFEDLVEKIAVRRDTGRNPVFDVMFNQVSQPEYDEVFSEVDSQGNYKHNRNAANFDLEFTAIDNGRSISCSLTYCTVLFKPATIDRFIRYFRKAIPELSANPGTALCKINILTREEKNRLLYTFNDTRNGYRADRTIHELFEEQVGKNPYSIAVVSGNSALTYHKLNSNSLHLARHLRNKGVIPGKTVGIMSYRSIEMLVGVMGILKSGGAYLPVDPDYPENRTAYVLAESRTGILLTTGGISEKTGFAGEIIRLTGKKIRGNGNSTPGFCSLARPNDSAYIIYTSGSTGKPKGVVVTHYSVLNTLSALQKKYPLQSQDVYLFKTSPVFDVSAAELFGWFLGGGRLEILKKDGEKEPQKILDIIEKARVTHINFVPSLFNVFVEFLDKGNTGKLSGLKYIFLAGEALSSGSIKKFRLEMKKRNLSQAVRLENIYGPTEASIYSSWYSLSSWKEGRPVLIGEPLDNVSLYVVNRNGELQPVGLPGELCIGGAGLAVGYLNNPGLSDEKFIDNPFNPGERIYKTGDLARWQEDGNIEFLGRIDQQVKIRGFRIELGEIESCLLNHGEIKEALTIVRDEKNGEKYLYAYIVPCQKGSIVDLRGYLSELLPYYMVPSYFITLDKIPLTANGKIDRRALPEPLIGSKENYRAPRNEIETKLIDIWSEILRLDGRKELQTSIGIDDNFFELGGHSLKATVLLTKIYKKFNVNLTLKEIFRYPTIRGLSTRIRNSETGKYASIKSAEKKEYYRLSSAQKRLFFLHQVNLNGLGYNLTMSLPLEEDYDMDKLKITFKKLICRYESLRTSFEIVNDEPVQKIYKEVEFIIESFVEKGKTKEEIIENFRKPFHLACPPHLRVGVAATGEKAKMLLIDMHHIITDGMSSEILAHEFMALYADAELPETRLQYKDYVEWQNGEEYRDLLQKQEAYWLNEFSGKIPVIDLPLDYPRTRDHDFTGISITVIIGKEETRLLKKLAEDDHVTLYIVLFSLLNILLFKICRQEDIIIGTTTLGRRHDDLMNIVGLFTNTLAIRYFPEGEKSFRDFLQEVKGKILAALENQDYPFEQLVEKTAGQRDLSRNPLFDIMFDLHQMGSLEDSTDEFHEGPFDYRKNTNALFDMIFTIYEFKDNLNLKCNYSTKLFKKETVERMLENFKEIVKIVLENGDIKLHEIKISHRLLSAQAQPVQMEINF